MRPRTTIAAVLAAGVTAGAFAGTASAHTGTACTGPGGIAVTSAWPGGVGTDNGNGTATIRWPDRYSVVVPLAACPTPPAPEPTPAPTPTTPETTPQPTPEPAPTCADLARLYPLAGKARRIAWGCATPTPVRPKPSPLIGRKTVRTVKAVGCFGDRPGYRIDLIHVEWTRDGVVVKTRNRYVRIPGRACSVRGITG